MCVCGTAPHLATSGAEYSGVMMKEEIVSFQYSMPVEGLTLSVSASGGLFVYGSSSVRNPTYITSEFATGGSGSFFYYAPSTSQEVGETLYLSLVAASPTTTFSVTVSDGPSNMTTSVGKFNDCCNNFIVCVVMLV